MSSSTCGMARRDPVNSSTPTGTLSMSCGFRLDRVITRMLKIKEIRR
ncbi:hypothetical protein [Streptomyces griseus]